MTDRKYTCHSRITNIYAVILLRTFYIYLFCTVNYSTSLVPPEVEAKNQNHNGWTYPSNFFLSAQHTFTRFHTFQDQTHGRNMRGASILFLLLSLLIESTHSQNDYAEYARGESIDMVDLQPKGGAPFFCFIVFLLMLCDLVT